MNLSCLPTPFDESLTRSRAMARMIAVLPVLVFCLAVPAIATAQQDEPV